jgi:hypothetical protein
MRVAFSLGDERYEAELLARKSKHARVGWKKQDVPQSLASKTVPTDKRPG